MALGEGAGWFFLSIRAHTFQASKLRIKADCQAFNIDNFSFTKKLWRILQWVNVVQGLG